MNDDGQEPEDEPPEPAPDAAQDEGAKPRKVSEEDLRQILAAHETWLETDGEEGIRAHGRHLCRVIFKMLAQDRS